MRHYEERGSEQVLESYFEKEAKDELVGPAKRSMEVHNVDAAEVEGEGFASLVNRFSACWGGDQFSTTWLEQLLYLSHRNVVNTVRTKDVFVVRIAVMLVLALAVGTMYLQLDDDQVAEISAFFILSITIVFFNSLEILPACTSPFSSWLSQLTLCSLSLSVFLSFSLVSNSLSPLSPLFLLSLSLACVQP